MRMEWVRQGVAVPNNMLLWVPNKGWNGYGRAWRYQTTCWLWVPNNNQLGSDAIGTEMTMSEWGGSPCCPTIA